MVNQQLIDWIKSEEAQGYTPQQLYNSLIQQGYNPNEVNEAIKIASQPNQQVSQSSKPIKKSFNFLPIIIIGVIAIGLIGGGIFFFTSQDDNADSDAEVNSNDVLTDKETEQESEQLVEEVQENEPSETELSGCDAFPDKLDACEPFSCEFEHPFTGEMMEKEVTGLVNGKCQYTEEMPNNGRMDCEYTESMRKAVAQYYRDVAAAESTGTSVSADLGSGDVETTYTIDGKEVENPLQEAMTNGQCTISGYDNPSQNNNDGDLEIEWGDFVKTKGTFDKDVWKMEIKITNNQNKMVILDLIGTGKERNWGWEVEESLDSGESEIFDLNIKLYFFDEVAFDKKNITILAYECNKLSKSVEEELCVSEFGFDGKLSPWQILKNKEEAGTLIEPTSIYTKYFDYNSLESPPSEISVEEYLK